jgi:mannitol operon repressor
MLEQQSNNESEKRSAEFKDMMGKAAKESDRGFVITTAAVLDFYLERVIKAFLIEASEVRELFEGAYAPLGDLSGKIKAAYVMGLVTKKESGQINAIRKVRNIFAHEIDASFTHPRVEALCKRLPIHNGKDSDRDALIKMSIDVGLGLIHRDIDIAKNHKRKPREEPKPLSLFDSPVPA